MAPIRQLLSQLFEEVVRSVEREEAVGAVLIIVIQLAVETDNLRCLIRIVSFDVIEAAVDFAADVQVTASAAILRSLGRLLLPVFLRSLLVYLLTRGEFLSDFFGGGIAAVGDPWVANDVRDAEALVWVVLQHASYQVLELFRVEAGGFLARVSLPEHVRPVLLQELEIAVVLVRHREGRVARVEDEEDDCEGEQVDNLTLVRLSCQDLGSHVPRCANLRRVGSGAVTTFKRTRETKVDNFNVVVFVE